MVLVTIAGGVSMASEGPAFVYSQYGGVEGSLNFCWKEVRRMDGWIGIDKRRA